MSDLSETWRHLLRRGLDYHHAGRFEQASEALERALGLADGEAQVLAALGNLRRDQGRMTESLGLLKKACEVDPGSAAAGASLARVLGLHMGRAEEAISVLERVSAGSRARARGPLELVRGEILLDQEQPVQAGAAFEIALKDQRSARAARKGLARCANVKGIALAEQGELEPALFQLKRAADLDPDWSGPCVNMGVVLGRLGKIAPVLEAYEAAMEREPGNPVIYYNLGTVLQQMGRLKEAAGALEDLLDLDPGFPNARLTLANLLGELKELGRARELLEEEVETDPSNPACWTSLGLTHICCGDDEQGERCLDRALELDPDYFNAIQNLLNLYIKQGRRQEAAVLMARARRLDPVRAEAMVAASPRFESQPEPLSEDPA